ncbi:MAG: hypothetical protein UT02_C0011G0013 [Parcubacteria group bacterium GW2011_GWC2_38_7]|nr:MAG: hypothetical protein UT02_C0011G0013 [Parcubacteria group bacterium GW2011_GWC2_38_7]
MQNSKNEKAWWQPAIEVFVQVSGWIVFPLLIGIYLGRWLQDKWGHEPWIYISCVAVAFVITNVGLIFIILKAAKQMQKVVDESKEQKK